MAKKTSKPKFSQEEKAGLKILREKGLYRPENPRKPTKYAKSLLRKYSDVTKGEAAVVTVKATKTDKGYKRAHEYSGETREGVRVVRNKIIVPKSKDERVTYSRKEGRVHVTRTVNGVKYRRSRLPHALRSPDGYKLKKNERFAVPMRRGNKIDWYNFTQEEFEEFWHAYVEKEKDKFPAGDVQIMRVTQAQEIEEESEEGEGPRSLYEIWNSAPSETQTVNKKKKARNKK